MPETPMPALLFQALSEPLRLSIVRELMNGEATVNELTRSVQTSQPSVSKHLKQLRKAGVVGSRPEGQQRWYHLQPDAFDQLRDFLRAFDKSPAKQGSGRVIRQSRARRPERMTKP